MNKEGIISKLKSEEGQLLLLSSAVLVFTFFLIGPIELYFTNTSEFWFGIDSILGFIILFALVAYTVVNFIGLCLSSHLMKLYAAILFGLGVGLYIQGNFLNWSMRQLDGQEVNWLEDITALIISSLVWVVCIVVPIIVVLLYKHRKIVFGIIAAMVVVMQLSSVVVVVLNADSYQAEDVSLSTEKMFELSDKKNIVVFVVDTLDAQFFESIIMDNPKYDEILKDFTYYNNAVAGGGPTVYGLPMLLTGQYYEGQDYNEYLNDAFYGTNFYKKLKDYNFDSRIYTNNYYDASFFEEYIDNSVSTKTGITSVPGIINQFYKFAAYKYFPNFLKNYFLFYSGDFQQYKEIEAQNSVEMEYYNVDDATTIQKFRSSGLTLNDETDGAFRVYHLFGSHGPYTLNADGTKSEVSTSLKEQTEGIFTFIQEYIQQMKMLDIYSDSTILIAADHGGVELYQNPAVLIKCQGTVQSMLQVSQAPITHANILPTLSQQIDGVNTEDERTIFEIGENEEIIRYQVAATALVEQYYGLKYWYYPTLFEIGGNARDSEKVTMVSILPKAEYKLGEIISFTAEDNGLKYFSRGMSVINGESCWTDGTEAAAEFHVGEVTDDILANIQFSMVHGKQRVIVKTHETVLFDREITMNTPEIEFMIPQDQVLDGAIQLTFEFPNAAQMVNANQEVIDQRVLAVAFYKMKFEQAEGRVPSSIEPYTLGETISFTAEDNGLKYFSRGMSVINGESCWTDGTEAAAEFYVGEVTDNILANIQFSMVHGKQRVIVKTNETVLFDKEITVNTPEIEFLIPQENVSSGVVRLTFEFPNAAQMVNANQEVIDQRVLAVAFYKMKFEQAEGRVPSSIEPYTLGETISFTAEDNGLKYFSRGMSVINGESCWTDGTEAAAEFYVGEVTDDILANIQFSMVHGKQRVIVKTNETVLFDKEITMNTPEIEFLIPQENISSGVVRLTFEFPNAAQMVNANQEVIDQRVLAVAFYKMKFEQEAL